MNQMPCSATWLERETDAGTRPLIPVPHEEINLDRESDVMLEEGHICRIITGQEKDYGRDGTIRSIDLATEVACGVMDREHPLRDLVRLICARRVGAFTVTDAEIARVVEAAVTQELRTLADARVPA